MMFITTVNNHDWMDWFAKNGGSMPNLHWHLYVFLERIFNELAGFSKDFGNVNIISKERPITNLNTRFFTRVLRIMRAFIDQINLTQSTNLHITICRDKIYKYELNPFNNTKGGAKAAMRIMDNTRANYALAMKLNRPFVQRWLIVIPPSPTREAVRLRQPSARKRLAAQEGPLRQAQCHQYGHVLPPQA
jgi:hypothetical protein